MRKPKLIIAADWSKDDSKRWMVRATYCEESGRYQISSPEPVGRIDTLLRRLQSQAGTDAAVLVGFDFPIGLPIKYAQATQLSSFREALKVFAHGKWSNFYTVSDSPLLHAPFYPLPKKTGQKGNYKQQLVNRLGFENVNDLLRTCDQKTTTRQAAECLFFTLGGKQVGQSSIVGWRDVLTPAIDDIHLWPFDGNLVELLDRGGVTIAEIYPAESYRHLGISIGSGTGRSKAKRQDRLNLKASPKMYQVSANMPIDFTDAARSWIDYGFQNEDQFDAMAGLISMVKVVLGDIPEGVPDEPGVRHIEGWILGQQPQ